MGCKNDRSIFFDIGKWVRNEVMSRLFLGEQATGDFGSQNGLAQFLRVLRTERLANEVTQRF
jgi:hypothetical protein